MQALLESTFFSTNMAPWIANLMLLFFKGVLVLSATWIIAYVLRGSAAAVRYTVWCAGLLSLMLLPVLSSVLPAWQLDYLADLSIEEIDAAVSPDERAAVAVSPPLATDDGVLAPEVAELPAVQAVPADPQDAARESWFAGLKAYFKGFNFHWTTWAFVIWLLGVFVAMTRLALAHAGATMLVRRSELVHDEDWQLLAERVTRRLGIDGYVRLRQSSWTAVPMSVGIMRPVVVLPENANEWDEAQRNTVMYHELAHVKRRDCLLHLLTQITCALYWFNPLVWVAARQLMIERERACDDLVLEAGVDASSYAETLLQTARQIKSAEWSNLATLSMARQSQLEGRLLSILDPMRRRNLNKASLVLSVFMVACIVLPLAVMQPASAQQPPNEPTPIALAPRDAEPVLPDVVTPAPVVVPVPSPMPAPVVLPEPTVASPAPVFLPAPDVDVVVEQEEFATAAVQLDSLSIDQIIQLRKYGIDADFILSLKELGYTELSFSTLIGLGKYGANGRYIRDMRDAGYTTQSLDDYAEMSKYGVDPEYVAFLDDLGYSNLSAHDLTQMSKYGVDPELVALLDKYGYEGIEIEDLVSASKYGVHPDLVAALDDAGYKALELDDLIQASKYGVKPSMLSWLNENGYGDASLDDIINASKYGLRSSLAEALQAAGYDLSLSDLIQASKFGVDGELIESLKQYGYDDLTADELINASKFGVDNRMMASLASYGLRDLSLSDVISMRKYGVDGRYLKEMSDLNMALDADELIRMRKYGVDATYIKEMKKAGVGDVSVDELIDMRKHGVDADFIKSLKDN